MADSVQMNMVTGKPMIEEPAFFYSGGCKLDASFFWPAEGEVPADKPVFVICSGFTGLKSIHPARYSRFLTRMGYPCFGFDYRGFEKSGGERKRVLLEEQVEDIVHAVSYVMNHPQTAGRPVILMGWGMAGGMVLEAARLTPPLKALVAANGFYNAVRVQKALRGKAGWLEFWGWLQTERANAAVSGEVPEVDPFRVYPLDPVSEEYVNRVLRAVPGYNEGAQVKLNFADSLLRFAPENNLDHLKETPLLLVHGDQNALHPVAEAESLHEKYPGPKTMYWVPEAGHTEWMLDDNLKFQHLVAEIDAWVRELA